MGVPRLLRFVCAASVLGAVFLWVACSKKEEARASGDSAKQGPVSWADTAEAVFPRDGLTGLGATFPEVTGRLGEPSWRQEEGDGKTASLLIGYDHEEQYGARTRLIFQFESADGKIYKVTRVYWTPPSPDHSLETRTLPDPQNRVNADEAFLSQTMTPSAIRARWGEPDSEETYSDTLPSSGESGAESDAPVIKTYQIGLEYPYRSFYYDEEELPAFSNWSDPAERLPSGLRVGDSRLRLLQVLGLPFETNDPRGINSYSGLYPRPKDVGDEEDRDLVIWGYVTSNDNRLRFRMHKDTITAVTLWFNNH